MATKVDFAARFERELDRLARKYPSAVSEVAKLVEELQGDKLPGDRLRQVGIEAYKVRLSNPDAGTGKSGGFRALYFVRVAEHVVLITIYHKPQQDNIDAAEVRRMIQVALDELGF